MRNEKEKTKRPERSHCYKASKRVTLTPGIKFRAAGGPYYEARNCDGSISRIRMRDSGPFIFYEYERTSERETLLVYSQDGGFTTLNVGKAYRNRDLPSFVNAPYRNIRRVGSTKRERAAKKADRGAKK